MIKTLFRGNWFLGVACLLLGAHQAQAITISFSSDPGATVTFKSDSTFQFAGSFLVDLTDGVGDSLGLHGNIAGPSGGFTIGSITTDLYGNPIAPVSGLGTFTIFDGIHTLSATLDLSNIYPTGTGAGTNSYFDLNLTGITYSGINSDLQALASTHVGAIVVSFPFSAPPTLEVLKAGTLSPDFTSYSGSVWAAAAAVPDGGSTLALLGVALVGVEGLRRKLKLG